MKQLLCLSHTPWQARPNRTQQLLARLSDVQILFLEPPVPRGQLPLKQERRMRPSITVYTLPNPRFPDWQNTAIQRRNHTYSADFIHRIMAHHHLKEPVLWCTHPSQSTYLDHLAYRGLVYDCYREWDEEYLEQESDLVCHSDVVFAASPGLVQRLSPCNDAIVLLPNGVNDRMFTRTGLTVPMQISHLPHPILGRVGDIDSHIELEPMLYAARTHPEWTFLLMGRITPSVRARIKRYPNIVPTGPVHPVELPDYFFACDVLFDLFHTSTKGSDIILPRIYEYLASGKPIVTMVDPDQVEPFPDVIYTAYDEVGFMRRCRSALMEESSRSSPRRQAHARQASWASRSSLVMETLNHVGLF